MGAPARAVVRRAAGILAIVHATDGSGSRPITRDLGAVATVAVTTIAIVSLGAFLWLRVSLASEAATVPSDAWSWATSGAVVVPIGPETPFQPGDRVVTVGGVPLETWADRAFSGSTDPDAVTDPLPMVVVRNGSEVALDAPLGPFPVAAVLAASWALVTFTVLQLALATWLLVRRPTNLAVRILFVGSIANLASAIPWQLGLQPSDLVRGWPNVVPFMASGPLDVIFWSCLLHLILVYPSRSPVLARHTRLSLAIYVIPLTALIAATFVTRIATPSTLDWMGGWLTVQAWVVLGLLGTILVALIVSARQIPEAVLRGIRWVVISLILAAAGTMILVVGPLALTGSSIAPRGILALLALPIPLTLSIAIIRDRLFERDQLLRSRERLVMAREEERRRLRRRLHDGIGPTLAAMAIQLDVARDQVAADPDAATVTLGRVKEQTQGVLADIRSLARELRPPALDELGLVGALRQRAAELSAGSTSAPTPKTAVEVTVEDTLPTLPAAVEVAAYRIASEAMLNAIHHGHAATCWVRLSLHGPLIVEVEDDGPGFDVEGRSGVGILAMHERATELGGTLAIGPRDGGGTRVLATLPWQA